MATGLVVFLLGSCSTGGVPVAEKTTSAPAAPAEEVQKHAPSPYAAEDADGLLLGSKDAVDDLAASLASVLPQGSGVLVASFVESGDLNDTTNLGRLLAAQFSSGLTRTGYAVKESRLRSNLALRPGRGEFALTREAAALARDTFDVSAILYGFYTVDRDAVYVSARVAKANDGAVVAAEDYALLNRSAVTRLLGDNHSSLFERYVRTPTPVSESAMAEEGLRERDLTEEPAGRPEPAFRIFPPTRLNP
jgi:hypothetical protein